MGEQKALVKTTVNIRISQVFMDYCIPMEYDDPFLRQLIKNAIVEQDYKLESSIPSQRKVIERLSQELTTYFEAPQFLIRFNETWNKLYKYLKLYNLSIDLRMPKPENTMSTIFECLITFIVESEVIYILNYHPNNSITFITHNNSHLRFVQLLDHIKCYLL